MDEQPSLRVRCERFLLDDLNVLWIHDGHLNALVRFVMEERAAARTEKKSSKGNSVSNTWGLSAGGGGRLGNPTLVHSSPPARGHDTLGGASKRREDLDGGV